MSACTCVNAPMHACVSVWVHVHMHVGMHMCACTYACNFHCHACHACVQLAFPRAPAVDVRSDRHAWAMPQSDRMA
eukprot:361064-Chlamydomonas_euryale.AAC.2